jgi:large subunit ribosomal protein L25
MAELKLRAERRDGAGKGVARKLRAVGRVPGVLYGHGREPLWLSLDSKELFHALHGSAGANVLVDLVVDGKQHLALPREVQRDHVRGQYLHVDFLEVRRDEKVEVTVPIRVVGESPGVKAGGVLEHHLWDVHVQCLPGDVPEAIEADISTLQVGDSLRGGDLAPPAGVSILTAADESVLGVVAPQARVVEEEVAVVAEGEAAAGAAETAETPAEPGTGEGSES